MEEDDLVPAKAHPKREAAVRFNPGPDSISQVEERRLSAGSQEGEMLQLPSSGQAPEQGRREDWSRIRSSAEDPLLARRTPGREREGRGKLQSAYLHKFPKLKRGKAKLEAERSSLSDIVESIVQEGCNKRKAELIEKSWTR